VDKSCDGMTEDIIAGLVDSSKKCFKDNLRSIVLFGSGAEGTMRAASDLNFVFILKAFDQECVNAFREPFRMAHLAGRAKAMFVLENELLAVAEAFAVKFDDIERRHRILYGEDLLSGMKISREAKKSRLRQTLLNIILRLRERYVLTSLREEQLQMALADVVGAFRAAAATLQELEGENVISPHDALNAVAARFGGTAGKDAILAVERIRDGEWLPEGTASSTLFVLLQLAGKIYERVIQL